MHYPTKRRQADKDTAFIYPDKTFLGASETDIIAVEREIRHRTTTYRRDDDRRRDPPSMMAS